MGKKRVPKFCVSCQHYSFAVNAFVEVVKESTTRTSTVLSCGKRRPARSLMMWRRAKRELGLLYLSESNETVLSSCCAKVSSCSRNCSLPHRMCSSIRTIRSQTGSASHSDELKPYPYLIFEQGTAIPFYFSEELLDMPAIQVRDRVW